jgi:hypothetical protein
MLATRQCDTSRFNWSKLGTVDQNSVSQRMSNHDHLSAGSDWREDYSQYLSPLENTIPPSRLGEPADGNPVESSTIHRIAEPEALVGQEHSLIHLPHRNNGMHAVQSDRSNSAIASGRQQSSNGLRHDSAEAVGSTYHLLTASAPSAISPSVRPKRGASAGLEEDMHPIDAKEGEDEDDDEDDEEMLELEECGVTLQTDAERRAERRKMKRFRYAAPFCPIF